MSKYSVKIEMTPEPKEGERYPSSIVELSVVIPDGRKDAVWAAVLGALLGGQDE